MKVSVLMVTYNHENYIAQAIDSILMQQTQFDYEIVIGEDCSTDNTRSILAKYEGLYPERIRLILNEKNLSGMPNLINAYKACRGEYIAAIEGDDYWTDPLKLQIQSDLLDKNKDVVMCFHNAKVVYENGSGKDSHMLNVNQKETVGIEDLVGEDEKCFIATASMMSRRSAVPVMPNWLKKCKSGDIPMWILMAKQGSIRYIDRPMSVWRRHPKGQSFTDDYLDDQFILNRIYMYSCINMELRYKYKKTINKNIARYYRMLPLCRTNRGKPLKKIYFYLKASFLAPPRNVAELKHAAKLISPNTLLSIYSALIRLARVLKN